MQLDCIDQTKEQNLCSLYQAKVANCTNFNYQESHEPDWECDYLDLDSKVVAIGQISCGYPLGTLPEDIPFIYKKDTCILVYSLELKAGKNRHPIQDFKNTNFLTFWPDTKDDMSNYFSFPSLNHKSF